MVEMQHQLAHARRLADTFRSRELGDPATAEHAIRDMVVATDFYHQALFERTAEFYCWSPARWGPFCAPRRWASCATPPAGSARSC